MKRRFMLVLLVAGLAGTSLSARDATLEDKITSLYISYFNRAPDYSGLSYWKTHGEEYLANGISDLVALEELSAGFATHPTFTDMYASMSNEDFVKAIYRNALGRDGDAEGIKYWTDLINEEDAKNNKNARSEMVAKFMDSSLTVDLTAENFPTLTQAELDAAIERQTLIANKVTVGEAFADTLTTYTDVADTQHPENDPAYIASQKVLENVGLTQESVDEAVGKIYALTKDDLSGAIDAICNVWDMITPDYSFKDTEQSFQEAASQANYVYIFNNMTYSDYEKYSSGEYGIYNFTTVPENAHCTEYGFTAADQTTVYNYQGIEIAVYSIMSPDYTSARICTEANYAGTIYSGTTNGVFYGSSAATY